ncbi:hypothetical protein FC764_10155 [Clostridium botulinum]|nr:hypothetical protein [Clostridium botulinum]
MDKISIKRHENKYNKYFKEIIDQQEMIKIIEKNREDKNEYVDINFKIAGKKIFAFLLVLNDLTIGIACLDELDFENKNCKFKAGIFKEYLDLVNEEQVIQCIKEILAFQERYLGIRRSFGVIDSQSAFINSIDYNFKKEGINLNKDKIYYSHLVKDSE